MMTQLIKVEIKVKWKVYVCDMYGLSVLFVLKTQWKDIWGLMNASGHFSFIIIIYLNMEVIF